jgi:hypothetical protein
MVGTTLARSVQFSRTTPIGPTFAHQRPQQDLIDDGGGTDRTNRTTVRFSLTLSLFIRATTHDNSVNDSALRFVLQDNCTTGKGILHFEHILVQSG